MECVESNILIDELRIDMSKDYKVGDKEYPVWKMICSLNEVAHGDETTISVDLHDEIYNFVNNEGISFY